MVNMRLFVAKAGKKTFCKFTCRYGEKEKKLFLKGTHISRTCANFPSTQPNYRHLPHLSE